MSPSLRGCVWSAAARRALSLSLSHAASGPASAPSPNSGCRVQTSTPSVNCWRYQKSPARQGSLCERVCWRTRQRNIFARTITLKLRYADFETLTRARTIRATNIDKRVLDCVQQLFRDNYDGKRQVQLLGIALSGLEQAPSRLELPFDDRLRPHIGGANDAVRERFGYVAIRLGLELPTPPNPQ